MALSVTHRFHSAKADSSDSTLIQPSNWNDSHIVSGLPIVAAADYDFTPIQPGGTLSIGANTITLSTVPDGVNGSDTHHYLYISGGTGTAEAVLITGGTGVAGGTNGQIIVTCANTHSGAWTIKSATAGLSEAVQANGSCKVFFGGGNFDFYGTFWSPGNVSVEGSGMVTTTLRWNSLNTKMFDIERDYFYLSEVKLLQVGTATAGSIGIYQAGSGSGVTSATCNEAIFRNIWVDGFHKGIYLAGAGQSVDLDKVTVINSISDGITALSSQGYWTSVITELNGGNGVTNGAATPGGGWTPWISGLQTFGNAGWGLYSTFFLQVGGHSFFNNDRLGGIYHGLVGPPTGGYVIDSFIQYEGAAYPGASWSTNTSAPGISSAASASPLTISNVDFYYNQGNHIEVNSNSWKIMDNRIALSGAGVVAGSLYGIKSTGQFLIVSNNTITESPCQISGHFNNIVNNKFIGTSASPLLYVASGQNIIFDDNWFEQGGAGTAYTLDAGVLVDRGNNTVVAGTITNNSGRDTVNYPNNPLSVNYIATETGSNNAIAGSLGTSLALVTPYSGLIVQVKLAHTLQAGANTFTLNGGSAVAIKSSRNPANNIATAYASTGTITLLYDATGPYYLDMSQ